MGLFNFYTSSPGSNYYRRVYDTAPTSVYPTLETIARAMEEIDEAMETVTRKMERDTFADPFHGRYK